MRTPIDLVFDHVSGALTLIARAGDPRPSLVQALDACSRIHDEQAAVLARSSALQAELERSLAATSAALAETRARLVDLEVAHRSLELGVTLRERRAERVQSQAAETLSRAARAESEARDTIDHFVRRAPRPEYVEVPVGSGDVVTLARLRGEISELRIQLRAALAERKDVSHA